MFKIVPQLIIKAADIQIVKLSKCQRFPDIYGMFSSYPDLVTMGPSQQCILSNKNFKKIAPQLMK